MPLQPRGTDLALLGVLYGISVPSIIAVSAAAQPAAIPLYPV
ncbi:MAG: hypothetical protein Q4C72_01030 [Eubacteriales bacterium]|nr:hypothetical protein [Eubacteriales bacterium]